MGVIRKAMSICTLLIACFAAVQLAAQLDTGGVTGTVKDFRGAVLRNVRVTLTNEETGVVASSITTSTGVYVFDAVQAGRYTLKVEESGFRAFITSGIVVNIQQTVTVDATLSIGSVSQDVVVTATETPLLQTENGSVGQTVNGEMVNDLPLDGRDWVSLSQIAPGVTTSAIGEPSTDGGSSGSAYFVVNGTNLWQNDIRLNGINDNIEMYGGAAIGTNATITPPPDAIQQFRLQSGSFSAEFGHSTGGVVNATTKSGTNELHGDVWDYVRSSALEANSYFSKQNGIPIAPYRRNQFGATMGGPIVIPKLYDGHDKTFFFLSYQGTRSLQANSVIHPSANEYANVPTALEQSSSFTNFQDIINLSSGTGISDNLGRTFPLGTIFDPATTRSVAAHATDPVTGLTNSSTGVTWVRDPFYTGGSLYQRTSFATQYLNLIPPDRLDPNAVALLHAYPLPNVTGAPAITDNYFTNPTVIINQDQEDVRLDHSFGGRDTAFATGDYSHLTELTAPFLPGIIVGDAYGEASSWPAWMATIGYNHLFTPTLINEFHIGYNHSKGNVTSLEGKSFGIPAQYGISGIPQIPYNGGLPVIAIAGLTAAGPPAYVPTLETIHAVEIMDNLTWIRGGHTLKVGYQTNLIAGDITQPWYGRGYFDYSGWYSQVPGNNKGDTGMADMLLTPVASSVPGGVNDVGGVDDFSASNFSATDDTRRYMGIYLQDDWKMLPTVTINAGLRWDYFSPYEEKNGRQGNFIETNPGYLNPSLSAISATTSNITGESGIYYLPNETCHAPRAAAFDALLASYNVTIQCTGNKATGDAQKTNFAPRVGFNVRVRPNAVVRGGYGIAFGALANIGYGGTLGTNYPFAFNYSSPNTNNGESPYVLPNGQTATMENAFTSIQMEDPTQLASADGVSVYGRQYNYQTPYVQSFNLMMQDQFTQHDSFLTGYVGALGRHLDNYYMTQNSATAILPTTFTVATFVPFQELATNTTYETTNGMSNYNSLQTDYMHEGSDGLNLIANYSYAKCMTDQKTQARGTNAYRAPWLPGFGIEHDMGLCDSDATHVVHVAATYRLPIGTGRMIGGHLSNKWNLIAGNWQGNVITTWQTGQPFTLACPTATSAAFGCNANKVPDVDPYAGPHDQKQWLNPAAFVNPTPASVPAGSLIPIQTDFSPLGGGPQQVRGPAYTNVDSSLFKSLNVSERNRVEFRAEAFNLLNHTQLANPTNQNNFQNTKNFSEITSLRHPNRLIQLSMKVFY